MFPRMGKISTVWTISMKYDEQHNLVNSNVVPIGMRF